MWIQTHEFDLPEDSVEIRCPGKFQKLFLVLRREYMPVDGMYMEIACSDCAKMARANGQPNTKRFLHYYDADGNCVANKMTTY